MVTDEVTADAIFEAWTKQIARISCLCDEISSSSSSEESQVEEGTTEDWDWFNPSIHGGCILRNLNVDIYSFGNHLACAPPEIEARS
jgi:hypothetical protein